MTEVGGPWSLTSYCCWCGSTVVQDMYGFFTCIGCVFHRLEGPVTRPVLWHSATQATVVVL